MEMVTDRYDDHCVKQLFPNELWEVFISLTLHGYTLKLIKCGLHVRDPTFSLLILILK